MAITDAGEVTPDNNATIYMDYLDAQRIIPLSVCGGVVTEAAFVSEETRRGESYVYLELHELENNGTYCISNLYFKALNNVLVPEPLPAGVAPVWHTGSTYPLFALVSPNEVNNIECNNGLGISVFQTLSTLYKALIWLSIISAVIFYLGGKKVFTIKR